jgi:diguanylate cyclase (GGDEF)-like protein
MICKAADILRESVRIDDLVTRTGGDEFTIILPETNVDGLQVALERIHRGLVEANQIEDGCEVKISLGAAIAKTNEKLLGALKVADMKMYQNKAARKNAG